LQIADIRDHVLSELSLKAVLQRGALL